MKSLKQFITLLMVLAVCGIAKADNKPDDGMFTKTHAINTYIDAMTLGKLDGLTDVVDPSAKFTILKKKHLVSSTKKEMMDFLGRVKGIEYDCTTSTSVVEANADVAVVKVDMQFPGFTRSNYVTIANTGSGWKIINVYSVFN